jgi:glycosyltransferase involved in cell wall biosynthesis
VVISDLGSTDDQLADIRHLAARHGARLIETRSSGLWNRAKALNIGIQAARGTVVLCTDVDMVFEPNFLSTILDVDEQSMGRNLAVCRSWDLPE